MPVINFGSISQAIGGENGLLFGPEGFTGGKLVGFQGEALFKNGIMGLVAFHALASGAAALAATDFSSGAYTPPATSFYLIAAMIDVVTAGGAGTISANLTTYTDQDTAAAATSIILTSAAITSAVVSMGAGIIQARTTTKIQVSTTFNAVTVGSLAYTGYWMLFRIG